MILADLQGHGFYALAVLETLPDPGSDAIRSEDNPGAGVKKHGAIAV